MDFVPANEGITQQVSTCKATAEAISRAVGATRAGRAMALVFFWPTSLLRTLKQLKTILMKFSR